MEEDSYGYRDLDEMARERGLEVDHTTMYRWVIKFTPKRKKATRQLKRPVGNSCRLDETYFKVKGQWKYLYRVVDKEGNTVDYLLTAKCDRKAAERFICKAIGFNEEPIKVNIDKSVANTGGMDDYNDDEGIEIRHSKYLNNSIEQDHRPIMQLCRATLGFKRFHTAKITIAGFEVIRMIRKRQIRAEGKTSAEIFYSMAE